MNYSIEYEREKDGRWIIEVHELHGVMAYGTTADEAMTKNGAGAVINREVSLIFHGFG
jgi:hypothetical protein